MQVSITEKTIRQFIAEVSDQHYTMSGSVLAASAAQSAALGEACMQISLDNQVDKLDWQDVAARIEQMVHLKNTLTEWGNQDATALVEYIDLHGTGGELKAQKLLCESPAEITRLSLEAITVLQNFRPLVFQQVAHALEMVIILLSGVAQAGVLLLESNLQRWPDPSLAKEYELLLADLKVRVGQLKAAETT